MFEFGSSLSVRAVRVNPLRLVPFENAVSDGIYAVLLGFGYGRKAVLVGHDDQPIYRTAGFLCRNDCFVKTVSEVALK